MSDEDFSVLVYILRKLFHYLIHALLVSYSSINRKDYVPRCKITSYLEAHRRCNNIIMS